jgi:transcriptional regulator with GAF, ATPase, and Fis domain
VIRVLVGGSVQYLNSPAREMLASCGWHEEELLPQPLLSVAQRVFKNNIKYELELACPPKRVFSIMLSPSKIEGWVNLYGRDITKRKQAEKKLARTQEELKKRIEEQLVESYKHLGLINRKISMLLELEKHSQSQKDKQEIVDYIARSALGLAHAKAAFLYIAVGKNHFNLISSEGFEKDKLKHVQVISSRPGDFIDNLVGGKSRVSGPNGSLDSGYFNDGFNFSYFVALPILSRDSCKGFLFLGFTDRTSMDSQEFEFLDVFSRHVSSALNNSGILK